MKNSLKAAVFLLCSCLSAGAASAPLTSLPVLAEETADPNTQNAVDPNTLVIYTVNRDAETEAIIDGFEARYPELSVKVIPLTGQQAIDAIQNGSDLPAADVMWGGLSTSIYEPNQDLWESYISENEAGINPAYQNQGQTYTDYALYGTVFLVNDKLEKTLKTDVNSYADLLEPELHAMIAMGNPETSVPAAADLASILAANGGADSPEAWTYAEELTDNMDGIVLDAATVNVDQARKGKYAVAITSETLAADSFAKKAKDEEKEDYTDIKNDRVDKKSITTVSTIFRIFKNIVRQSTDALPVSFDDGVKNVVQMALDNVSENLIEADLTTAYAISKGSRTPRTLTIVYPEEGVLFTPTSAAIVKDASNPEAAKLFIDYLLSSEAQQALADINIRGVNTTINPTGDQMKPWDEITVLEGSISAEDAKKWNNLMADNN